MFGLVRSHAASFSALLMCPQSMAPSTRRVRGVTALTPCHAYEVKGLPTRNRETTLLRSIPKILAISSTVAPIFPIFDRSFVSLFCSRHEASNGERAEVCHEVGCDHRSAWDVEADFGPGPIGASGRRRKDMIHGTLLATSRVPKQRLGVLSEKHPANVVLKRQ